MRNLVSVAILVIAIAGCQHTPIEVNSEVTVKKEYPTVNIPPGLRQRNWLGPQREGSCVHATMISLFRWQGRYHTADYWRRTYADGEMPSRLAARFDHEGIRYAYTVDRGDVKFLEWACNTRRGCGVTCYGGRHMIALVHLDDHWAGLLDNNRPTRFLWVPRKVFISEWLNSGSWAITPIYTPAPPLPQ